ncbi:MAG: HigA family addiction module antidote protein [Rhizobiaceae bacterium]|nr:HigA family addiction module antidote protein [Rhizobiaceae bacterium]
MTQSRRSLRDPNRAPSHPGAFLNEIVLEGGAPTKSELAAALGISRQMLHGLLSEKHAVTADMAVRLGHVLGDGPEIWLRMQQAHDLWHAERKVDTGKLKILNQPAAAE